MKKGTTIWTDQETLYMLDVLASINERTKAEQVRYMVHREYYRVPSSIRADFDREKEYEGEGVA